MSEWSGVPSLLHSKLRTWSMGIKLTVVCFLALVASVGLPSTNAGWIFTSRKQGFRALAIFGLLHLLIYLLLRLEDNALLAGAIASFAAIAAAMYFTRNLDWYGSPPETAASSAGASHAK